MQVNFDGGFYALYPQKLEPGATKTFDIRKIRDQQIPDSQGRQLPLDLSFAQIRWSLVGAPQTRLIGRSEVVSKTDKVSSRNLEILMAKFMIWTDRVLIPAIVP
jgi:hypothetical protein